MKRVAGILLPITSLPSPYGIGGFSQEAYRFVDWLCEAGQSFWQILPLGQTGYGDSPYQSFSSRAGNPYMISLEALCKEGLLTEAECEAESAQGEAERVDYGRVYQTRYPLLRLAFERSKQMESDARERWIGSAGAWLEEYALFMAIKEHLGGIPLSQWHEELRLRNPSALERCRQELSQEIEFQKFMQAEFFLQWNELKNYANERGIRIIGDLPIYVSADSVDVWTDPELFLLDESGIPTAVAGCPPDAFTPLGQLWGNPLYRWEAHERSNFGWWRERLAFAFTLYDGVRIDHFRGFDAYYSIPYGAENAVNGHWEQGPGMALFEALKPVTEGREVIAEDLGYMTDSVRRLVLESGFAGMKVLQFGFDSGDRAFQSEYLPHRYPENSAVYPGTHDNPTLLGWLSSLNGDEVAMVRDYLWDHHTPTEQLGDALIALLMRSTSRICVVPLQDYLGLDDSARMNRPSTTEGNWSWRVRADQLTDDLAYHIRRLCVIGGRVS